MTRGNHQAVVRSPRPNPHDTQSGHVPQLVDVLHHVELLRQEVEASTSEVREAAACCRRIEDDYYRRLTSEEGDLRGYLESRLASFESFIIQKVKSQTEERSPPCPDERSPLDRRQSILESKLDALVADFVVTHHTIRRDLETKVSEVRSEFKRQRNAMEALRSSPQVPFNGMSTAIEEARMRHLVDVISMVKVTADNDRARWELEVQQWRSLFQGTLKRVQGLEVSYQTPQCTFDGVRELQTKLSAQAGHMNRLGEEMESLRSQLLQQFHSMQVSADALVRQVIDVAEVSSDQSATLEALAAQVGALHAQLQKFQLELPRSAGVQVCVHCRDGLKRTCAAAMLSNTHGMALRSRFFQTWLSWRRRKSELRKDQIESLAARCCSRPLREKVSLKDIENAIAVLSQSRKMNNVIQCFNIFLRWASSV